MNFNIPLFDLSYNNRKIRDHVIAVVERHIETSTFILGPDVKLFEDKFSKLIQCNYTIGVNSGADALQIADKCPNGWFINGDEIILFKDNQDLLDKVSYYLHDDKERLRIAKEIDADFYSLSILAPYYGTKMYFDLMKQGFELDKKPWEYFFHQTAKLLVNENIKQSTLNEYLRLNELNEKNKGYI